MRTLALAIAAMLVLLAAPGTTASADPLDPTGSGCGHGTHVDGPVGVYLGYSSGCVEVAVDGCTVTGPADPGLLHKYCRVEA